MQILGGPEVPGQDGAGGIVDGPVQGELGAARLEPRVGAGVELHEGTHLRLRCAPQAPLAAPALPFGGQAEGAPEASPGGPAEQEALDLLQLLGGRAVVEAGVGALQQRGHTGAHVGRQPPAGRRPAAQPVQEAARTLRSEPHLTPLKLPQAHVHRHGAFGIGDLPGQRRLQQPGPRYFLSAHRQCLPCLHGVTFLLNS